MSFVPTQDAEYYQAHKDDPGEWGESEPTKKPRKRRLAAMISARFAPEEEELVRRAAAERGESVSRFVRESALREARRHIAPTRAKPTAVSMLALRRTRTGGFGPARESEEGGAVIAAPMASVLLRPTGTTRLAPT
jgi:Protein of unknown function (DUF1778)